MGTLGSGGAGDGMKWWPSEKLGSGLPGTQSYP